MFFGRSESKNRILQLFICDGLHFFCLAITRLPLFRWHKHSYDQGEIAQCDGAKI